jgi:tetratricopeptide (TPR) repeat protein
LLCALAFLANGCAILLPQTAALRDAWPAALPDRAELADVPFYPQVEYQCGPAALATIMTYAGQSISPDDLVPQVYLPERKGTLQIEMLAAPRRRSLVSYQLAPQLEDLLREVAAGTPVVVLHGYGVWPLRYYHYTALVGFDRGEGEVLLRSGTKQRQRMPIAVLEYTWKDSDRWAMVTMRPDRIPVTADETRYVDAIHAFARVAEPAAAMTAYRTALARWPSDVPAAIGLANLQHEAKRLDAAEETLRQALARNPDSPVVLNNLAQVVSDRGRHAEALELLDRALRAPDRFESEIRATQEAVRARQR